MFIKFYHGAFFTTIVEDETVVYEVQIKTGDLDNAETPKQVTLQLIGKYGRTSKNFIVFAF